MGLQLLIILGVLLVLLTALRRYPRELLVPFLVAFAVALAWTSYYRYEYVSGNLLLFDQINLYPLILWTAGLTLLYLLSRTLPRRYNFLVTTVLYLTILASLEAVGYHLLGVRLNSNFTSLLNLGVIHAPRVMQAFYVLAGPLYLLVLYRLPRIARQRISLRAALAKEMRALSALR